MTGRFIRAAAVTVAAVLSVAAGSSAPAQGRAEREPPLHRAAREGDGLTLQRELDRDSSQVSHAHGSNLETPLMFAARSGEKDMATWLPRLAPTREALNARARDGRTALMIAASHGVSQVVAALRDLGADVTLVDHDGRTALMHAARLSRDGVLELLIPGSTLDASDDAGWTALHHAAWSGDAVRVRLLVEAGATIDAADRSGRAPLHVAGKVGAAEVVEALLDANASPALTDREGVTPLMLAAQASTPRALNAMLAARDRYAPGLDASDASGRTALMHAILTHRPDHARRLIEAGASVSPRDSDGRDVLFHAIAAGDAALVRELLSRGADAAAADRDGRTALMVAAALRAVEARNDGPIAGAPGAAIIDTLLAHNTRPAVNAVGPGGTTALIEAASRGGPRQVAALLRAGAAVDHADELGRTALIHAAGASHDDAAARVVLLLDAGASIHHRDLGGLDALMHAARRGSAASVQTLLSRGANAGARGEKGESALMFAAGRSDRAAEGMVELLAPVDPRINDADERGMTALQYAARHGTVAGIRTIIARGGAINARDRLERTPLMHAAMSGRLEHVEALLAAGADAAITDKQGRTALDHARSLGVRGEPVVARLSRVR